MSVMDVPFFGTRAVLSSEDNRGVEKGENVKWSKRSRGWAESGSRAGPNRKSSLHDRFQRFYNLGTRRGFCPAVAIVPVG